MRDSGLWRLLLALAFLAASLAAAWSLSAEWTRRCEQRGGHVVNVYKGSICVSQGGRIIEIP